MKKRFDVLGLGAVAVDELILAEQYPLPDSKARVLRVLRQCGGLTGTALIAASRLGAKCAYAGMLGTDDLSQFALGELKREGVNLRYLKRHSEAAPPHSFIIVDARRQTRNVFSHRPPKGGPVPNWPSKAVILSSRVLLVDHFGDIGATLRAARIARDHSIPVVADFERESGPEFPRLLEMTDHLILSATFAATLTGESSPRRSVEKLWATAQRSLVAVTAGKRGCWFRATEGSRIVHQPAFEVQTVDTTGCGDVFHGAYAAALAKGFAIKECIRRAAAAAALKAARFGTQDGIPTATELLHFLRSK